LELALGGMDAPAFM